MPEDSPKDRWIASGACLAVAAIFAVVAVWAVSGTHAAGSDYERFGGNWRAQRDIAGFSGYLIAIGGLSGIITLGMVGLAVWIPLAGRFKRGGRTRTRRGASPTSRAPSMRRDPLAHPRARGRPTGPR